MRRSWVSATALVLSSIMTLIGSVPRDAVAGIASLSQSAGASIVREDGTKEILSAAGFAHRTQPGVSTRFWTRFVILLLIFLLILWLIYRTFNGWKPMIS